MFFEFVFFKVLLRTVTGTGIVTKLSKR